jgi:hypothetical protein
MKFPSQVWFHFLFHIWKSLAIKSQGKYITRHRRPSSKSESQDLYKVQ